MRRFPNLIILLVLFLFGIYACQSDGPSQQKQSSLSGPLFQLKDAAETGVDFVNVLQETDSLNYFNYMHLYIGAGVATGDVNNDGLPDLFFVSNRGENKLYLNKGNLQFEDVTQTAGLADPNGFSTGATMNDVNGDGWMDIYVCRAGWFDNPAMRANRLFINNQDGTFSEQAQQLGVANTNYSMQSSFFDYDKDGDLDLYVMNAGKDFVLTKRAVSMADIEKDAGFRAFNAFDVLYRNDGAQGFTDVTAAAGLFPDIGFGLGLVTSDFNQDGWTDIYVGNDFIAPDFLYINQGDGTFKDESKSYFKHTTFYSMGTDVGDINNDGLADLFVLDMLPEDYKRSKTTMEMVEPKNFAQLVEWEYNYQYMHNMLHLNTGQGVFSEVSQLSGVQKSDWSWSVLLADLDNDQMRDIYITNGIYRNMTEQDLRARVQQTVNEKQRRLSPTEILDLAGSTKIANYAFKNLGDLQFQKTIEDWGFNTPTFSNGAAVTDLDQDGDLDIVINNLNDPAFIYENQASKTKNHFIGFKVENNERAIAENLKVNLRDANGQVTQTTELMATRGFFSSSEPIAFFGLGDQSTVPVVEVIWPNGKMQVLKDVKADQYITLKAADAQSNYQNPGFGEVAFEEVTSSTLNSVFKHEENEHFDFYPQILLPHQQSQNGPFISVGDVNKDDLDDFFVGGAQGQAAALYLQQGDGTFQQKSVAAFNADRNHEDMGSLFFDADGDQDLDLYVVSGGFESPVNDAYYQDRLYLNDGKGNFSRAPSALPQLTASGSCVKATDIDNDGDLDLFVGGRVVPDQYPYPPQNYILKNEGGTFQDVTAQVAAEITNIGMVTDAEWVDLNGDQVEDLILVGEWMDIRVFENQNGRLADVNAKYQLSNTTGWWNKITPVDLDGDGDLDFIAGNLGLNYKFHASEEKPFKVYCDDFDKDGAYDIVLAKSIEDDYFPIRGRTCSSEQMPFIKEKFPTFKDFANADLSGIYGQEQLDQALKYEATLFENVALIREGDQFLIKPLPMEAQIAPIHGIICEDFNEDGTPDLLIAGNHFGAEVETTKADAGNGLFLIGNGNGTFRPVPNYQTGVWLPHAVKDLKTIKIAGQSTPAILAANNDQPIQMLIRQANAAKLLSQR